MTALHEQVVLQFCKTLRKDGAEPFIQSQTPRRGNTQQAVKVDWLLDGQISSPSWAVKTIFVTGPARAVVQSELKLEAAMLEHFEQTAPELRVPRLYAVCETGEKFGAPGIIMDWVDGEPLGWTTTPRDLETKEILLAQVADVCLALWLHPAPPALLDISSCSNNFGYNKLTALAYVLQYTDRRLLAWFSNEQRHNLIDALLHQAALMAAIVRHQDIVRPTLFHNDLGNANILVDSHNRAG